MTDELGSEGTGKGGIMTLEDFFEYLTGLVEWQPWRERANCRGLSPSLFLPEKGDSTREAKQVCAGCDVRQECLDYALTNYERWGIWGGTSERKRKELRRDMPRSQAMHGTVSRYNHGCHCDECKAVYAAYRRQARVRAG